MVALNFNGSVSHSVNWLINHYCCMGLTHYLIYLVALRPDKQGDHAFRDKNNNRKIFSSNTFEYLINIRKQHLATLILLFHLFIKNLCYHLYLLEYYVHLNQECLNQG